MLTWNLRHFDVNHLAGFGVKVQTPDYFLAALFDASPEITFAITRAAWANLTRSAPHWEAYLDRLSANRLYEFVNRLRQFGNLEV